MASLPSLPNGPNPSLCAPSLLRHCRSASELGAEADPRGPFKLARMDTFPARHVDFESQMAARGLTSAVMLSSSSRSDSNLGDSSTTTVSPGSFLRGYSSSSLQARPTKSDDVGSLFHILAGGSQSSSIRVGSSPYHGFIPNQVPSSRADGARSIIERTSGPFTAEQWLEFSQQTYIFKHLAAGVKPPPALLLPLVSGISSNSRFGATALHIGSNAAVFGSGVQGSTDPEPGRCRRTDGKKWRCARDVVQDQKYCERHMHRGRHRSRSKNAETLAVTTSPTTGVVLPAVSNAPSDSADTNSGVEIVSSASNNVGRLAPLSQQVTPVVTASSNSHSLPFNPAGAHGSSSTAFPKTCLSSSSSLALSREGQIQFSLLPSGTFDDASRGFRLVSSNLRPDQVISTDASDLKRLFQGPQRAGNSPVRDLLPMHTQFNQLSNAAPVKESLPDLYTVSHVRSQFSIDNASKSEAVNPHTPVPSAEISGLNGGREADDFPFRLLMNDWSKSRDSSSLSWCDLEEHQNSNKTASSTELSMSNQMSTNLPFAGISSRLRQPSPLRLSVMKGSGDDLLGDSVDMGLSMGVGVASADESRDRQQSNWVPIAWDSPLVGGPLAEVLHSRSSTPRGQSSSSLNLLGESWEHQHQLQPGSPKESNSASLASPTDVLQKTMFGSYADSSSSGSSPRSAPKVESRFCDAV